MYSICRFPNKYFKHHLAKYVRTREGKNLIPTICSLLMARIMHTQTHIINKNIDNYDLSFVNRITLELPLPEIVPDFSPGPVELVSTCKYSRAPKGKAYSIWNLRF